MLESGWLWLSWLRQEALRLQGIVALLQWLSSCHRVARLIGTRSTLAILLGRHGILPPVTVTLAGPGSWVMDWIRSEWVDERTKWEVRPMTDYKKECEKKRD